MSLKGRSGRFRVARREFAKLRSPGRSGKDGSTFLDRDAAIDDVEVLLVRWEILRRGGITGGVGEQAKRRIPVRPPAVDLCVVEFGVVRGRSRESLDVNSVEEVQSRRLAR